MAELKQENPSNNAEPRKIRAKRQNTSIDFTAMVDLAFLLITFFMLTTTLSKPMSMDLAMPEPIEKPMPVDENRTMTILIDHLNVAQCYMGKFSGDTKKITLGTTDLRKELALRKKEVYAYSASIGKPEQGLIVLIKPGKQSNYRNLIDVLDEMAILDVSTYAITDLEPAEQKLLKQL